MSYLLYKQQLSLVHLSDVFHREWNDCKNALGDCQLWNTVVLTTMSFNLFHGPWGTCSWHGKVVEEASDWLELVTPRGPLFQALYERICSDMGLEPLGTPEHHMQVLLEVRRASCL